MRTRPGRFAPKGRRDQRKQQVRGGSQDSAPLANDLLVESPTGGCAPCCSYRRSVARLRSPGRAPRSARLDTPSAGCPRRVVRAVRGSGCVPRCAGRSRTRLAPFLSGGPYAGMSENTSSLASSPRAFLFWRATAWWPIRAACDINADASCVGHPCLTLARSKVRRSSRPPSTECSGWAKSNASSFDTRPRRPCRSHPPELRHRAMRPTSRGNPA